MSEWNKYFVTPQEFHDSIIILANKIPKGKYEYIYAIPRGGLIVGVYLSHYLELEILDKHDFAVRYTVYLRTNDREIINDILIVDDLSDTGVTLDSFIQQFDVATIHYKPRSIVKPTYYVEECPNDRWIVYPFEKPDEEPNREVG